MHRERPVNRAETRLDHVTPYDRFAWSDVEIEHLLATGAHQRDLIAYFGAQEYLELAALARKAAETVTADAPKVFVVPGIMGSQLGLRRTARQAFRAARARNRADRLSWGDALVLSADEAASARRRVRRRVS
jgi:putative intracellular protease/amidase